MRLRRPPKTDAYPVRPGGPGRAAALPQRARSLLPAVLVCLVLRAWGASAIRDGEAKGSCSYSESASLFSDSLDERKRFFQLKMPYTIKRGQKHAVAGQPRSSTSPASCRPCASLGPWPDGSSTALVPSPERSRHWCQPLQPCLRPTSKPEWVRFLVTRETRECTRVHACLRLHRHRDSCAAGAPRLRPSSLECRRLSQPRDQPCPAHGADDSFGRCFLW